MAAHTVYDEGRDCRWGVQAAVAVEAGSPVEDSRAAAAHREASPAARHTAAAVQAVRRPEAGSEDHSGCRLGITGCALLDHISIHRQSSS